MNPLDNRLYVSGEAGTDTAALTIDVASQQVEFQTGAAHSLGASRGDVYRVWGRSNEKITAARIENDGTVNALVFDPGKGWLVWTKASAGLLFGEQAIFFECR